MRLYPSVAPTEGLEPGVIYYDKDLQMLRYLNNTGWINMTAAQSGSTSTSNATSLPTGSLVGQCIRTAVSATCACNYCPCWSGVGGWFFTSCNAVYPGVCIPQNPICCYHYCSGTCACASNATSTTCYNQICSCAAGFTAFTVQSSSSLEKIICMKQ